MNDAEYIAAIAEFYKDGPGPEFRAHYERLMHISAAIAAAPAQAQEDAVATPAQPLHVAAINCPHEIDKDRVVLHYDSKQPGKNALAQLAARLQAAQAQPVATIYVTEDGSREVDDWKVELPVGATTLYTAAQAQPDDQQARGTDAAKPAQPRDDPVFVVWWSDHMPNSTEADAWAEWCALRSNQPPAQAQDAREREAAP